MLIGLCGRSGSGKGYIAALFAEKGIPAVDTDKVYRDMTAPAEILSPCMRDLAAHFGESVKNPDNSLNRAVMRSLVFAGEDAEKAAQCGENLTMLNRITHAHILEKTREIAHAYLQNGAPFVLIDAPVLYESGFDAHCAAVLCITAPEEVRIARIMKRDGITREAAVARLQSQMANEELLRKADFVLENDGDKEILYKRVEDIIARIMEKKIP